MNKEELIEELKKLENTDDPKVAHGDADALLLVYIDHEDVTNAFMKIPKWYA